MTKSRLMALMELGDADSILAEQDRDLKAAVAKARVAAKKEAARSLYGEIDWASIFQFLALACTVGCLLYFCVWRSIADGRQELADCAAGKTVPCQQAVMDAAETRDVNGNSRVPLYKAAYREATGADLPALPR